MKPTVCQSTALLAITLCLPAGADTIYSNLLDTPIATDFTGITLTVDGGTINPFFGGVGVANDNLFQPVRSGTGNLDTIQNVAVGSTIDVSRLFATGYGGSQDHLGTTFTAGTEGYIGFKANGTDYGWMRVVFTGNTSGAVVKDWAYDNSGAAIVVGRIQQSSPSAGAQLVTISPGTGEAFTLGTQITNTGGNTNSVLKTGAGIVTLTGTNTYAGATTINGGKLVVSGSIGNSAVTVNNSGTVLASGVTGTIGNSVIVNNGAILAAGGAGVAGTATVGSGGATFNTGSIFQWDLNAGTTDPGVVGNSGAYDQVAVTGNLGGANAIFNIVLGTNGFSDAFWNTNKSWSNIFTAGSPFNLGSIFSSFSGAGVDSAGVVTGQGSFTLTGNTLSWSAVPEPSSALAGLLLGAGWLRRRRRVNFGF